MNEISKTSIPNLLCDKEFEDGILAYEFPKPKSITLNLLDSEAKQKKEIKKCHQKEKQSIKHDKNKKQKLETCFAKFVAHYQTSVQRKVEIGTATESQIMKQDCKLKRKNSQNKETFFQNKKQFFVSVSPLLQNPNFQHHPHFYVDSACNKQTSMDEDNPQAWISVINGVGIDMLEKCLQYPLFQEYLPFAKTIELNGKSPNLPGSTSKCLQLYKKKRVILSIGFPGVKQQNNGGELFAMLLGLKIALFFNNISRQSESKQGKCQKKNNKYGENTSTTFSYPTSTTFSSPMCSISHLFTDSNLILQFWSKGLVNPQTRLQMCSEKLKMINQCTTLRQEFEQKERGCVQFICGDQNPADLGTHKPRTKRKRQKEK